MKKKKSKIKWQRVTPQVFPKEAFELRNIKVDVHMKLDADVVEYFRNEGEKMKKGYQTLINETLRKVMSDEHTLEERVTRLERALKLPAGPSRELSE